GDPAQLGLGRHDGFGHLQAVARAHLAHCYGRRSGRSLLHAADRASADRGRKAAFGGESLREMRSNRGRPYRSAPELSRKQAEWAKSVVLPSMADRQEVRQVKA